MARLTAGFIVQMTWTALIGVVLFGALLFIPAGTLAWWQGWVFLVVFLVSANAIGVYLAFHDPALLERRKKIGPGAEQSLSQRIIISLAIASALSLLAFCGLDHRFGWSQVPAWVALAGNVLIVLGFLVDLETFRENTYGASTIQTVDGQTVISTGLYGRVRHPMYAGVVLICVGIPLALGSWWGLVSLALTLPVLVWRILDEEALLKRELPGYREYTREVRYRLVPRLW
jgi:protein-S-isoprenylcysteine O-methyltransferase Ste14